MALAKLGLPSKVCSVYPMLTLSETVYYEVVTSGSAIGAKDAAEVDKFCQSNQIVIFPSNEIKEVSTVGIISLQLAKDFEPMR